MDTFTDEETRTKVKTEIARDTVNLFFAPIHAFHVDLKRRLV